MEGVRLLCKHEQIVSHAVERQSESLSNRSLQVRDNVAFYLRVEQVLVELVQEEHYVSPTSLTV